MFTNVKIFDTICKATEFRQSEAAQLSKNCQAMVVVGDTHSSNTGRLAMICREHCDKVFLVDNAAELKAEDFCGVTDVGITAGASTPAYIIKEVQQTMSEILNTIDEEFNFEEELEKTLKKIHTGMKVDGVVTSINNGEVIVDIGTKHTGYIPVSELTDDSTKKPEDVVSVGETVALIVLKTNDQEGIVTLSKKKVDAALGFEKIVAAKEAETILEGVVTNVVKGGVLVATNGVKVFVPASQATPRRDYDLNELLKTTVKFKILEVNEELGIGKDDEIKNVSFALFANEEIKANDGTVIPKDGLIEIVSVSENGKATFTTDIPFGKYYVQE